RRARRIGSCAGCSSPRPRLSAATEEDQRERVSQGQLQAEDGDQGAGGGRGERDGRVRKEGAFAARWQHLLRQQKRLPLEGRREDRGDGRGREGEWISASGSLAACRRRRSTVSPASARITRRSTSRASSTRSSSWPSSA